MYDFMRGRLAVVNSLSISLEVAGIGYKVAVPVSLHSSLPQVGAELLLYVAFVVREASHALYGFLSLHERNLFELLLDISGVGPKLALSIIGHMSPAELQAAILKNDTKVLCLVPGIGKKTAERLVIELRDKAISLPASAAQYACGLPTAPTLLLGDAMSALMNLGYNQAEAQRLLKKALDLAPDAADLGTLISAALKAASTK